MYTKKCMKCCICNKLFYIYDILEIKHSLTSSYICKYCYKTFILEYDVITKTLKNHDFSNPILIKYKRLAPISDALNHVKIIEYETSRFNKKEYMKTHHFWKKAVGVKKWK